MNFIEAKKQPDIDNNTIVVKGDSHWCSKTSPGCANCYAESVNTERFFFASTYKYEGNPPELELELIQWVLEGWKKADEPAMRSVCSMTDVFGEWVPQEWIFEILDAMNDSPTQTFLLLTKRPWIMLFHIRYWLGKRGLPMLPENIWCGISTENQTTALLRIPVLLEVPAAIRYISCEPLLEKIVLETIRGFEKINWIIVGGEFGEGARPCHKEWIDSLIQSATAANIPINVKQLGSNFISNGQQIKTGHPDGKDWDKWPNWLCDLRIREFPQLRS